MTAAPAGLNMARRRRFFVSGQPMPPKLVTSKPKIELEILRPMPSEDLREPAIADATQVFEPAPELLDWIRRTFLEESSPLFNEEHVHLRQATLGMLWTNVHNHRHMRSILGQAEIPQAKGGKWVKARHDLQLRQWFRCVPDFVITINAPYAAETDDARFCALIEHELLHCAQRRNHYGAPMFSRATGKPLFAIRGHDVEEFTAIVARYGAAAAGVEAMVVAAGRTPILSAESIVGACGTCLKRAA